MAELLQLIEEASFEVLEGTKGEHALGTVKGVKILGLASGNARDYTPEAVRAARSLYEGIKVNIDHRVRNAATVGRPTLDRFGKLTNVQFKEGVGLFGDLTYNPEHPYAKTFHWFTNNQPDAVGFSHHATGNGRTVGGRVRVESIDAVKSVDLVADPGTTRGLFESQSSGLDPVSAIAQDPKLTKAAKLQRIGELLEQSQNGVNTMDLKELTIDALRTGRPDLLESLLQERASAEETKKLKLDLKEATDKLAAATLKLAKLEVEEALGELLEEMECPAELVTPVFKRQLLEAADEKSRRELIEDRMALAPARGSTAANKAEPVKPKAKAATVYESRGDRGGKATDEPLTGKSLAQKLKLA